MKTYGAFQSRPAANPGLDALIESGGGIRKIRVRVAWQARGRSRDLVLIRKDLILLLYAYPKSVRRSDPEAGDAARQGSQTGVQG